MPSGSAGRRYAHAVFDLAKDQDKLEQWSNDLEVLAYTFKQGEVQNFLENPRSSRESKINFIKNTLSSRIGPEALNLAQLLVQRERQGYTDTIFFEFTRLWNRLRGIALAEVTTAMEVDAAEQEKIRENLVRLVGQQVTIEMKVDPTIIGGMVALVGDTLIDGSVRTRLQNLRKQLT